MQRNRIVVGLAAAGLVLAGTAASAGNPTGAKGTGSTPCEDGYTLTWTPAQVFPPNHKMIPATITYTSPQADEDVTLNIDFVTHDEFVSEGVEMNGAGNTPIDAAGFDMSPTTAAGTVSESVQIRAERSGRGDGRVYELRYTATSENGNDCSGTALVRVPHDMRKANRG